MSSPGSQCFGYDPFAPIDGGTDSACRGINSTDWNSAYIVGYRTTTLATCKANCAALPGCKGIEFFSGNCHVWTRPLGIQTTTSSPGHQCLRYSPFAVMGGADRACGGGNATDWSPRFFRASTASSLSACKTQCINVLALAVFF